VSALAPPSVDLDGLFTRLYAAYRAPIWNYLYRMVGDAEVAHDLTNDAFAKAWRALPTFRPEFERGWLYRIAGRVGIDHIRHRDLLRFQPWEAYCSAFHPTHVAADDPEREALQGERAAQVEAVLERLGPIHAEPLRLSHVEGLSYDEGAALLGVTHAAYKSRMYRAREAFAAVWRELEPSPPPKAPHRRKNDPAGLWGSGLRYRPEFRRLKPWFAQPHDPYAGKDVWLGSYATREEATAAVAAWREARRREAEGAAA
jgi:RNA polymerase sigma factor (sigma-70 family)